VKLANVTVAQLDYLVAALDAETWKDAAEQVGVSPSAFSQGIAELERRLGIELFERAGRRRIPLPAAIEAARHASRILGDVGQLTRWASTVREGESGRLNIGMIDTAAVHHFGDTLVKYRTELPDVELRLTVQPSASLQERVGPDRLCCTSARRCARRTTSCRRAVVRVRATNDPKKFTPNLGTLGRFSARVSHTRGDRSGPS